MGASLVLIIFSLVLVVLFPLTLHGRVVRCQSTSSHGACRRLTVDQPNFRPTIDVHHTITCPFSMKLAILCTPVEYLKAFVHLQTGRQLSLGMERPTPIKDAAVHRLAQSIAQMTLCQVTTTEIDDATKLLEKARQKLQGIQNIPPQRVNDLDTAMRQLRQIGCILDSCTISASYEVTQAQKALLQLHHTAKGASTSSKELNAQISPRTDDEYNLPYHEDELQEH